MVWNRVIEPRLLSSFTLLIAAVLVLESLAAHAQDFQWPVKQQVYPLTTFFHFLPNMDNLFCSTDTSGFQGACWVTDQTNNEVRVVINTETTPSGFPTIMIGKADEFFGPSPAGPASTTSNVLTAGSRIDTPLCALYWPFDGVNQENSWFVATNAGEIVRVDFKSATFVSSQHKAFAGAYNSKSTTDGDCKVTNEGDGPCRVQEPMGMTYHSNTNLLIVDRAGHNVREIDMTAVATYPMSTLAGDGSPNHNNAAGTLAQFNAPHDIAPTSTARDTFLIVDQDNHRIRQLVYAGAAVTDYACTGATVPAALDGSFSTATCASPRSIATRTIKSDRHYFTQPNSYVIRVLDDALSIVATVVGEAGVQGSPPSRLHQPMGISLVQGTDEDKLFIVDYTQFLVLSTRTLTETLPTVSRPSGSQPEFTESGSSSATISPAPTVSASLVPTDSTLPTASNVGSTVTHLAVSSTLHQVSATVPIPPTPIPSTPVPTTPQPPTPVPIYPVSSSSSSSSSELPLVTGSIDGYVADSRDEIYSGGAQDYTIQLLWNSTQQLRFSAADRVRVFLTPTPLSVECNDTEVWSRAVSVPHHTYNSGANRSVLLNTSLTLNSNPSTGFVVCVQVADLDDKILTCNSETFVFSSRQAPWKNATYAAELLSTVSLDGGSSPQGITHSASCLSFVPQRSTEEAFTGFSGNRSASLEANGVLTWPRGRFRIGGSHGEEKCNILVSPSGGSDQQQVIEFSYDLRSVDAAASMVFQVRGGSPSYPLVQTATTVDDTDFGTACGGVVGKVVQGGTAGQIKLEGVVAVSMVFCSPESALFDYPGTVSYTVRDTQCSNDCKTPDGAYSLGSCDPSSSSGTFISAVPCLCDDSSRSGADGCARGSGGDCEQTNFLALSSQSSSVTGASCSWDLRIDSYSQLLGGGVTADTTLVLGFQISQIQFPAGIAAATVDGDTSVEENTVSSSSTTSQSSSISSTCQTYNITIEVYPYITDTTSSSSIQTITVCPEDTLINSFVYYKKAEKVLIHHSSGVSSTLTYRAVNQRCPVGVDVSTPSIGDVITTCSGVGFCVPIDLTTFTTDLLPTSVECLCQAPLAASAQGQSCDSCAFGRNESSYPVCSEPLACVVGYNGVQCSGRGTCVSPGYCACDPGYFGRLCLYEQATIRHDRLLNRRFPLASVDPSADWTEAGEISRLKSTCDEREFGCEGSLRETGLFGEDPVLDGTVEVLPTPVPETQAPRGPRRRQIATSAPREAFRHRLSGLSLNSKTPEGAVGDYVMLQNLSQVSKTHEKEGNLPWDHGAFSPWREGEEISVTAWVKATPQTSGVLVAKVDQVVYSDGRIPALERALHDALDRRIPKDQLYLVNTSLQVHWALLIHGPQRRITFFLMSEKDRRGIARRVSEPKEQWMFARHFSIDDKVDDFFDGSWRYLALTIDSLPSRVDAQIYVDGATRTGRFSFVQCLPFLPGRARRSILDDEETDTLALDTQSILAESGDRAFIIDNTSAYVAGYRLNGSVDELRLYGYRLSHQAVVDIGGVGLDEVDTSLSLLAFVTTMSLLILLAFSLWLVKKFMAQQAKYRSAVTQLVGEIMEKASPEPSPERPGSAAAANTKADQVDFGPRDSPQMSYTNITPEIADLTVPPMDEVEEDFAVPRSVIRTPSPAMPGAPPKTPPPAPAAVPDQGERRSSKKQISIGAKRDSMIRKAGSLVVLRRPNKKKKARKNVEEDDEEFSDPEEDAPAEKEPSTEQVTNNPLGKEDAKKATAVISLFKSAGSFKTKKARLSFDDNSDVKSEGTSSDDEAPPPMMRKNTAQGMGRRGTLTEKKISRGNSLWSKVKSSSKILEMPEVNDRPEDDANAQIESDDGKSPKEKKVRELRGPTIRTSDVRNEEPTDSDSEAGEQRVLPEPQVTNPPQQRPVEEVIAIETSSVGDSSEDEEALAPKEDMPAAVPVQPALVNTVVPPPRKSASFSSSQASVIPTVKEDDHHYSTSSRTPVQQTTSSSVGDTASQSSRASRPSFRGYRARGKFSRRGSGVSGVSVISLGARAITPSVADIQKNPLVKSLFDLEVAMTQATKNIVSNRGITPQPGSHHVSRRQSPQPGGFAGGIVPHHLEEGQSTIGGDGVSAAADLGDEQSSAVSWEEVAQVDNMETRMLACNLLHASVEARALAALQRRRDVQKDSSRDQRSPTAAFSSQELDDLWSKELNSYRAGLERDTSLLSVCREWCQTMLLWLFAWRWPDPPVQVMGIITGIAALTPAALEQYIPFETGFYIVFSIAMVALCLFMAVAVKDFIFTSDELMRTNFLINLNEIRKSEMTEAEKLIFADLGDGAHQEEEALLTDDLGEERDPAQEEAHRHIKNLMEEYERGKVNEEVGDKKEKAPPTPTVAPGTVWSKEQYLTFVVVMTLQTIYLPLTRYNIVILFCLESVQCRYECSSKDSAYVAIQVMSVVGLVLITVSYPLVVLLLSFRKNRQFRSIIPLPEQPAAPPIATYDDVDNTKGRKSSNFDLILTRNNAVRQEGEARRGRRGLRCDFLSNALLGRNLTPEDLRDELHWKHFLRADPSSFRTIYNSFRVDSMYFQAVLLLFKGIQVVVVLGPQPNTLLQFLLVLISQMVFLIAFGIKLPYSFPLANKMMFLSQVYLMLSISLSWIWATNQDSQVMSDLTSVVIIALGILLFCSQVGTFCVRRVLRCCGSSSEKPEPLEAGPNESKKDSPPRPEDVSPQVQAPLEQQTAAPTAATPLRIDLNEESARDSDDEPRTQTHADTVRRQQQTVQASS